MFHNKINTIYSIHFLVKFIVGGWWKDHRRIMTMSVSSFIPQWVKTSMCKFSLFSFYPEALLPKVNSSKKGSFMSTKLDIHFSVHSPNFPVNRWPFLVFSYVYVFKKQMMIPPKAKLDYPIGKIRFHCSKCCAPHITSFPFSGGIVFNGKVALRVSFMKFRI